MLACHGVIAEACTSSYQAKFLSTVGRMIPLNTAVSVPCLTPYAGNGTVRCQSDRTLSYEGGCGEGELPKNGATAIGCLS
jgi:hypothetical protein